MQTFGNNISIGGAALSVSSLAANQILQYNGTNWVNESLTVVAEANTTELEITALTATTVATFTPTVAGNFNINAYFRVITAATTVTLTATWTDVTGAQTYTWVSAVSEPVGSYVLLPVYINSTASSAITVTITAGTINQVYASASIISIT